MGICKFIIYIHKNKLIKTCYHIKNYYKVVYEHFDKNKKKMYKSSIKITTEDANTLKDGPTIFLTNNVKKMSMFYLKVSKISEECLKHIQNDVNENSTIINELEKVEKEEQQRLEKQGS